MSINVRKLLKKKLVGKQKLRLNVAKNKVQEKNIPVQ